MADVDELIGLFNVFGAAYRADRFDLELIPPIVSKCYAILGARTATRHYSDLFRHSARRNDRKSYWVFFDFEEQANVSRPYRPAGLFKAFSEWNSSWTEMIASIDQPSRKMTYHQTDRVIYSACISFFAVIDILRPGSRKTNGTFFEWLLGTLLVRVTGYHLRRQIPIAPIALDGAEGSVPTDIVIDPGKGGYQLVFPVKTSTRERIGQIFTHQRILDTEFPGKYRSSLLCVSETQLMKRNRSVQETCVPQQVTFNERYIAHIDALYYLDPPFAYIDDAIAVPVRRISDLFREDLAAISQAVEKGSSQICGEIVSTVDCNLLKGHGGQHAFVPLRGLPIVSALLSAAEIAD